ncbi:phosphatase 2C-domain-containing protein [Delphinella strobiligena]|nr:phosphatase 2C-domain-containing protein [Delphinella strobiligena]
MDAMIMAEAEKALDDPKLPPASFEAIHALAPALSGSCALLALYESSSSILRVANVGDSRAVLGRADGHGKYFAIPLSDDQTGFNASELARVNAEHPGESPIDEKTGRILGLAVTRAFGDARWKWADETMLDAQSRFWAHGPRPGGVAKTPPYLTAKPEIKEVKIKGEESQPDFLIMASDGFWDCTSSENAVLLVQQWIDARRNGNFSQFDQSIGDAELRAEQKEGPTLKQDLELKGKTREWTVKPEHFVVEDDNCATHLIKNAFGGNRRSLFCGVMAVSPPLSRDVRDDISVHVVFFGKV